MVAKKWSRCQEGVGVLTPRDPLSHRHNNMAVCRVLSYSDMQGGHDLFFHDKRPGTAPQLYNSNIICWTWSPLSRETGAVKPSYVGEYACKHATAYCVQKCAS